MFRRDYLLKMIEEITEAAGDVFGLRREKKHTEALQELDDLLNKHFRLHSRLLQALPPENIIDLFRMRGGIEADKLQQVALILEEEALTRLDMKETELGIRGVIKALHLYVYSYMHGASVNLPALQERIAGSLAVIQEYSLPPATNRLLAQYYECQERLDAAADEWFRMSWEQPSLRTEGLAFYERMLDRTDAELEHGGVTRQEIKDGLQELLKSVPE